jgi:hypothetical protein
LTSYSLLPSETWVSTSYQLLSEAYIPFQIMLIGLRLSPGYYLILPTVETIGREWLQFIGFIALRKAFSSWALLPSSFFLNFGTNTTIRTYVSLLSSPLQLTVPDSSGYCLHRAVPYENTSDCLQTLRRLRKTRRNPIVARVQPAQD